MPYLQDKQGDGRMSGNGDKYMTISSSMSGFAALGFLLFAVFAGFLSPNVPFRTSCGSDPPVLIPEATQSSVIQLSSKGLRVAVTPDGKIFLNSKWSPADTLPGRMRKEKRDAPIVLLVDLRADFGKVKRILQMAGTAGLRNVYLLTGPPHSGLLVHSLFEQGGRGWHLDKE